MNSSLQSTILNFILIFVVSTIITIVIFLLSSKNALLEPPEEWFNDWRTLFLSKQLKKQHLTITIIKIGEKSISEYPYRSPIDRLLISDLIKEIDEAEPAVIGIDFIFDWQTIPEKDRVLINTIQTANSKIVLGSIDKRVPLPKHSYRFQEYFLKQANQPIGHLLFEKQVNRLSLSDHAVRLVASRSPDQSKRKSFGQVVAEAYGSKKFSNKNRNIDWLRTPLDKRQRTFQTFTVRKHKPRRLNSIPSKKLLPQAIKKILKGKIVLIGGGLLNQDKHLTPLSIWNKKSVHGVEIHAQIVAQFLENRHWHQVTDEIAMLSCFIIIVIGIYIGTKWRHIIGKINFSLIYILVLGIISIFLFWYYRLILPHAIFFHAWVVGITIGSYWKYILNFLKYFKVPNEFKSM